MTTLTFGIGTSSHVIYVQEDSAERGTVTLLALPAAGKWRKGRLLIRY
jgi:hypothetical protein